MSHPPVDGKTHYGDRLYERASQILGYSPQALNDFKLLSERFEISWRHEISFQHHKEVASLCSAGRTFRIATMPKSPPSNRSASARPLGDLLERHALGTQAFHSCR
jgi:hypothetical protein